MRRCRSIRSRSAARASLAAPFFVLATQNPIEQEGTYPLPEAQLDRFMFNTFVDYPDEEEELEIVRRTTADVTPSLETTLSTEDILALQKSSAGCPWPSTWLATLSASRA